MIPIIEKEPVSDKHLEKADALVDHSYYRMYADDKLSTEDACLLVYTMATAAGVRVHASDFPSVPGIPDGIALKELSGWTVKDIRETWRVIALFAKKDLEPLKRVVAEKIRLKALKDHTPSVGFSSGAYGGRASN